MADLTDVYGVDYRQRSKDDQISFALNQIANNLANHDFSFKLPDYNFRIVWDGNRKMTEDKVQMLVEKIQNASIPKGPTGSNKPNMMVRHLDDSNPSDSRIIPYFIADRPVEYFEITDFGKSRKFIIYVTPSEVGAF